MANHGGMTNSFITARLQRVGWDHFVPSFSLCLTPLWNHLFVCIFVQEDDGHHCWCAIAGWWAISHAAELLLPQLLNTGGIIWKSWRQVVTTCCPCTSPPEAESGIDGKWCYFWTVWPGWSLACLLHISYYVCAPEASSTKAYATGDTQV